MDESDQAEIELLARYTAGPEVLETAVAGLAEEELDRLGPGDGWTIRQIVHHVADGDDLWKGFVKRALGNPRGVFELLWYWEIPQAEWAQHWAYAQREIAPSLALLRANRAHVAQLLESIPGAWAKSLRIRWLNGTEKEYTVGSIIEMQARHVEEHIGDIFQIKNG